MGGTKRKESGTASNGVFIHPKCHHHVEMNRSLALQEGWLVPQVTDPATVPIRMWDGWVLLDDAGQTSPVQAPTVF